MDTDTKSRFNNVYQNMMKTRWHISIITMITMLLVFAGISLSVVLGWKIQQEIKELMMLMLGAFISSYNRVIDFWFNNSQRDDKLIEKMDQEDDTPDVVKVKLEAQNAAGSRNVVVAEPPVVAETEQKQEV